jgi:CRP-like cAMP-binding protein
MKSIIEAIKRYIPVSAADEQIIDRLFHKKSFKKGEHLLAAGDVCRYVIFIETGLVRYYINQDGEEKTTYFNREGEFVCDYMSFLPQAPGLVNIQALEDTVVWVINHHDLQQFYKDVTNGERFGRLGIEEVFVQAILQIGSLYADAPEVRYTKFVATFPHLVQRIPQYYIASYVGVKPQSLSRIRRRMATMH